ncbi:MAG: VWA domain-containing protein [Rhodospirillales bacterium]|nr:VWA domain-containing protein [Rhodospirillales bacterium]
MTKDDSKLPSRKSPSSEVDAFLAKVAAMPAQRPAAEPGRLVFALDATASRQPTWDHAARLQGEMFVETASLGRLEIQICFYRGFGEFRVSPWLRRSDDLVRLMTTVTCLAGETQIRKVLRHTINETKTNKVNALVFVGDCVEEDVDSLGHLAGELGLLGVPAFMFHEGQDPVAAFAFRQIAHLTNGAYCSFDEGSAHVLKDLLTAVAVFAVGGRPALETMADRRGGSVLQIAHQLKGR